MKYLLLLLLFLPVPAWAGDCVLIALTGNGTDANPYRPNFPAIVNKIPNFKWTAHIPSKPDGSPQYPDAYVCFPDGFQVPPGLTALPPATAATGIKQRDPQASLAHMANLPPAVIKGSWRDYRDRAMRFAKVKLGAAIAWAAVATDNFNRADGALGANWSSGYGSEGTATIVSNAAECAIGVRCVASYNALVPGVNQYTQLVVTQYTTPGGGSDGDVGPAVRMPAPTSFDGYFARCGNFSFGTASTIMSKRVAGANTELGRETAAGAWAYGDVSRLEISGTGLTIYRNGVSVLTGTDSQHTSGRGGMMVNSANAVSSGEVSRADNFEVGDLGGAVARRRVVVVQ